MCKTLTVLAVILGFLPCVFTAGQDESLKTRKVLRPPIVQSDYNCILIPKEGSYVVYVKDRVELDVVFPNAQDDCGVTSVACSVNNGKLLNIVPWYSNIDTGDPTYRLLAFFLKATEAGDAVVSLTYSDGHTYSYHFTIL